MEVPYKNTNKLTDRGRRFAALPVKITVFVSRVW